MATPPTFISKNESVWNTATSPKSILGITVAAGDTLVVIAANEGSATTFPAPTGGTGLTYTQQANFAQSNRAGLGAWTVNVPSAQTFTMGMTWTGGAVWGFTVLRFSGVSGIGAVGSGSAAGNNQSRAITTQADNSTLVFFANDWDAQSGSPHTYLAVNGFTPTSANGAETNFAFTSGKYTVYGARYPDAGLIGAKTVGLSTPTGTNFTTFALELKGTTGGGPPASMPGIWGVSR